MHSVVFWIDSFFFKHLHLIINPQFSRKLMVSPKIVYRLWTKYFVVFCCRFRQNFRDCRWYNGAGFSTSEIKKPGASERELWCSSNSFTPGTRFHSIECFRALAESMNYEVLHKGYHERYVCLAVINFAFTHGQVYFELFFAVLALELHEAACGAKLESQDPPALLTPNCDFGFVIDEFFSCLFHSQEAPFLACASFTSRFRSSNPNCSIR